MRAFLIVSGVVLLGLLAVWVFVPRWHCLGVDGGGNPVVSDRAGRVYMVHSTYMEPVSMPEGWAPWNALF